MNRIVLIVLISLSALFTQAQTVTGDRVVAKQSLYLRNRWIDEVKDDTTAMSTGVLMTANAIRKFVEGRLLSPNSLLQNQYISAQNANAWISGRLRTGGKITTDSSLSITPLVTDPSNPVDGDIWQNSTGAKIKARIGGVTYNLATENYARGSVLSGGTIYVDQKNPYATDTRVGLSQYSLTAPFKTIQAAVNASTTTDVVYIRNGIYNENVTITNAGTTLNALSYIIDNATINGGTGIAIYFKGSGFSTLLNIYLINSTIKNSGSASDRIGSAALYCDAVQVNIYGNSQDVCTIASVEGNPFQGGFLGPVIIKADRVTFSSTNGTFSQGGLAGSSYSFTNTKFISTNAAGFNGMGGNIDNCYISGGTYGIYLSSNVVNTNSVTNSTIISTNGNAFGGGNIGSNTGGVGEGFYFNNVIRSYGNAFSYGTGNSSMGYRIRLERNKIDITNAATTSVFNFNGSNVDTATSYLKLTNNVTSTSMFTDAFKATKLYLKVKESNTNTADSTIFFGINTGFGTSTPKSSIDLKGKTGYNQFRLQTQYTPTSSTDANGNTGDTAIDDNYFYYKTSAGWKRMPLSTFLLPFLITGFKRKKTNKMKTKILAAFTICLLFFCSNLHAQLVPDSIAAKQITLSFKGKYHALLYKLMPDRGQAEAINYVNQVRKAVGNNEFDTAQVMTVTVSYRLVADMYYNLGTQQERLTAQDNADLKDILINTLNTPEYMDLLQAIMAINDSNHLQTEALRSEGIKDIMSIQLY